MDFQSKSSSSNGNVCYQKPSCDYPITLISLFHIYIILYIKSTNARYSASVLYIQRISLCSTVSATVISWVLFLSFFFFFFFIIFLTLLFKFCTVTTVPLTVVAFFLIFRMYFFYLYIVILIQQISQYFHNYWGVNFL